MATAIAPNWNALKLKNFIRYGTKWKKEEKGTPTLHIYVTDSGYHGFRVYMNDGLSTNSVGIQLEHTEWCSFWQFFEEVANAPSPTKYTYEIKTWFKNGQRLEEPAVTARLTIGKDGEGIVYLCVQPKGGQQAVFKFLPQYKTSVLGNEGEKVSDALMSKAEALGWKFIMTGLVNNILANLKEPGNNGQNTTSSGQAGYNSKSAPASSHGNEWDSADDIAF